MAKYLAIKRQIKGTTLSLKKINKELNNISPEKLVTIPHKSIIREPWMTKGLIKQINLMINT